MIRPSVKLHLLLLLLSTLLLLNDGAVKKKKRVFGGPSFDDYYETMVRAPDRLLDLDDDSFADLIVDSAAKRSFPVVVVFTVDSPRFNCVGCKDATSGMTQVVNSYMSQRKAKPQDQPIIFAKIDFDRAQLAFQQMGLETVPNIFVFKAKTRVSLPPPPSWHLQLPSHGVEDLLRSIKDQTGVDITPMPDASFTVQVGLAVAMAVALAVYLVFDRWEWTLSVFRQPWIWRTGSLLVYGFGVGGLVYCIIRTPPLLAPRQDGIHLFAMHTTHDQFVAEGLVIGAMNLLTALCFVAAFKLASASYPAVVQYVGANIFLSLGLFFLIRIFGLYESKARWYNLQAILPPPVSDFLFGEVKKNSGILKRLVRTSVICLIKYKDWPSFKKILKNIFLKYAQRSLNLGSK